LFNYQIKKRPIGLQGRKKKENEKEGKGEEMVACMMFTRKTQKSIGKFMI